MVTVMSAGFHARHVHSRHIHSRHLHSRSLSCARLPRRLAGLRDIHLIGDGSGWILVGARILVVVGASPSRTFITVNMPPISIGPN